MPTYMPQPYNPLEMPKTTLARQYPFLASEVLRTQEKEKTYQTAMVSGTGILDAYINNLSSQRISRVRNIEMKVKRQTPGFFRRIITGEMDSFEIDISVA